MPLIPPDRLVTITIQFVVKDAGSNGFAALAIESKLKPSLEPMQGLMGTRNEHGVDIKEGKIISVSSEIHRPWKQ